MPHHQSIPGRVNSDGLGIPVACGDHPYHDDLFLPVSIIFRYGVVFILGDRS